MIYLKKVCRNEKRLLHKSRSSRFHVGIESKEDSVENREHKDDDEPEGELRSRDSPPVEEEEKLLVEHVEDEDALDGVAMEVAKYSDLYLSHDFFSLAWKSQTAMRGKFPLSSQSVPWMMSWRMEAPQRWLCWPRNWFCIRNCPTRFPK